MMAQPSVSDYWFLHTFRVCTLNGRRIFSRTVSSPEAATLSLLSQHFPRSAPAPYPGMGHPYQRYSAFTHFRSIGGAVDHIILARHFARYWSIVARTFSGWCRKLFGCYLRRAFAVSFSCAAAWTLASPHFMRRTTLHLVAPRGGLTRLPLIPGVVFRCHQTSLNQFYRWFSLPLT